MLTFLLYLFTTIVIVLSIFIALFFKYKLEQISAKKKSKLPIHLWNLLIILTVSMAAYSVMALGVVEQKLNIFWPTVIIFFIIVPIYLFMNAAFKQYKLDHQNPKYMIRGNGKVIVLKKKYLKERREALKTEKVLLRDQCHD